MPRSIVLPEQVDTAPLVRLSGKPYFNLQRLQYFLDYLDNSYRGPNKVLECRVTRQKSQGFRFIKRTATTCASIKTDTEDSRSCRKLKFIKEPISAEACTPCKEGTLRVSGQSTRWPGWLPPDTSFYFGHFT